MRLLPSPLTTAALWALWLLLARSTSIGQVLFGLVLALVIPLLTSSLRTTKSRVRRPLLIVRFIGRLVFDVMVSNLQVAWGVLTWRWRKPASKFVVIPLDLRDPLGLAALSMVTSVVPGTVWSELALDRGALLLHVWSLGEERTFIAHFKARYEQPLREIFE